MIIRKKPNWFRMLFVWRRSVLPKLLPRLSVLFLFTSAVVYSKPYLDRYHGDLSTNIYTLFGIALAIFLGFRNTVSYDRFWEGRKLWGTLLNDTRSLAQQLHNFIPSDEKHTAEKIIFMKQMAAMVYALNHQLRYTDAMPELRKMLSPELAAKLEDTEYKPVILMRELGAQINRWRERGTIDTILQVAMDGHLANFSDVIGGCERIANRQSLFLMMCCCTALFISIAFCCPWALPIAWTGMRPLSSLLWRIPLRPWKPSQMNWKILSEICPTTWLWMPCLPISNAVFRRSRMCL